AFAEDVLVNAAVVVVDDATGAERLIPRVDPKDKVQLFAEALEVRRVFVEPIPDAGGKDFGVVVFVEEILEFIEELGNDAVRAFGFPPVGLADVFVLSEAIRDESEILNRAGKDELVDEEDDRLGGLVSRRPFDLVKFVEPDVEVLKELPLQFRLLRRVFDAAQGVEHAAGLAAAIEKIGERHFRERLVLKVDIARTENQRSEEFRMYHVFVDTIFII